jgi:hypothetical protein
MNMNWLSPPMPGNFPNINMTHNQVRNLPAGAFIKRKTHRDFEPIFGMVLAPADAEDNLIIAWEQESHPLYNEYDFSLDEEFEDDKETWRDPIRWRAERVPVFDEEQKTWWRNWKRIA